MCPGSNANHKLYGIHQILIVLFMFPWIKEAFNLQVNSANQITSNRPISPSNQLTNSPLELALKNAQQIQPAELQLIKIKRFFDQNNSESIKSSFKINTNTIIRTQDSRANGAKYINETELPTNDDCLKWCLETKECNLAVYEEKNQGSCYLFDCGTAADFKCKFTKHNFYTSSVLENSRRREENKNSFQQQHQHENDLVNLRTNVPINLTSSNSNNKSQTNLTSKQTTLNDDVKAPEQKCQKYQFACKNGLECIAIYNMCDNIKQCSDGSDEAAELHCPDPSNQIAQLLSISSSKPSEAPTKESTDKKQIPNQFQGPVTSNFNYKKLPEVIKLDKAANTNSFVLNGPKNLPNNNIIKPWPSTLSFDPNGVPVTNWNDYNNYVGSLNNQNAMNVNSNANQNSNSNSNSNIPVNSKDFNSLIWQMMDPNQQQQIFDALTNNIQQQQFLQNLINKQQFNNWLDNSNKNSAARNFLNYLNSKQDKQSANGQMIQEFGHSDQINNMKSNPTVESMQVHDHNPINLLEKSTSNKVANDVQTTVSTVQNVQSSNLNKDRYVSYDFKQPLIQYNGKEDYYLDENEQDTNSAVIALILGLFITMMLIMIVGFRMRSIKKRIQRRGGRTTLAHDHDYLVNGMYL